MSRYGMEIETNTSAGRPCGGWLSLVHRFARHHGGGFAVTAAVAFPALGMATALLVDGTNWLSARGRLQTVADGAALLLASSSSVTTYSTPGSANAQYAWNAPAASDKATAYVTSNLPGTYVSPTVQTTVDSSAGIFKVTVSVPVKTFLGTIAGPPYNLVSATASARMVGSAKLCIVALEGSAAKAIQVAGASSGSPAIPSNITGNGCSFFVNSSNPNAIKVDDASMILATRILGAGPIPRPTPANFMQSKPVADPLGSPTPPSHSACKSANTSKVKLDGTPPADTSINFINGNAYYLPPGYYCGGLEVTTGNQAILNTGIYYFGGAGLIADGGTLRQQSNSSGVTIVMDANAPVKITGTTTVNLNALPTGPTAGILLWALGSTGSSDVELSSSSARNLTGVLYLPRANLIVKNAVSIADQSPWTAIVANSIDVASGAKIVLNSNYAATNVPPPPLIKANPALQSPVLTQ